MYEARAKHPLSARDLPQVDGKEDPLWVLWVVIGERWMLGDQAETYRSRLDGFLRNRVQLRPLYAGYYAVARKTIAELLASGAIPPLEELFAASEASGENPTDLQLTKTFVVNELIALRLALGGFASFGASNYPGFFGGANVSGEPVPYRPLK